MIKWSCRYIARVVYIYGVVITDVWILMIQQMLFRSENISEACNLLFIRLVNPF